MLDVEGAIFPVTEHCVHLTVTVANRKGVGKVNGPIRLLPFHALHTSIHRLVQAKQ
jgi:hypothetical protein